MSFALLDLQLELYTCTYVSCYGSTTFADIAAGFSDCSDCCSGFVGFAHSLAFIMLIVLPAENLVEGPVCCLLGSAEASLSICCKGKGFVPLDSSILFRLNIFKCSKLSLILTEIDPDCARIALVICFFLLQAFR